MSCWPAVASSRSFRRLRGSWELAGFPGEGSLHGRSGGAFCRSQVPCRATAGKGVCGRPDKASSFVPLLISCCRICSPPGLSPACPGVGALLGSCGPASGACPAGLSPACPGVGVLLGGCGAASGACPAGLSPACPGVGALLGGCAPASGACPDGLSPACPGVGVLLGGPACPGVGALLGGCGPASAGACPPGLFPACPGVDWLLGGCGCASGAGPAGVFPASPFVGWSRGGCRALASMSARDRLGSGLLIGVKAGTGASPGAEALPRVEIKSKGKAWAT